MAAWTTGAARHIEQLVHRHAERLAGFRPTAPAADACAASNVCFTASPASPRSASPSCPGPRARGCRRPSLAVGGLAGGHRRRHPRRCPRAVGGIVAMMSTAARSGPGLELLIGAASSLGPREVFVASAMACSASPPARSAWRPQPESALGRPRQVFTTRRSTSAGSSRTRQASAATVTCPRSTAGAESGSVLMAGTRYVEPPRCLHH